MVDGSVPPIALERTHIESTSRADSGSCVWSVTEVTSARNKSNTDWEKWLNRENLLDAGQTESRYLLGTAHGCMDAISDGRPV